MTALIKAQYTYNNIEICSSTDCGKAYHTFNLYLVALPTEFNPPACTCRSSHTRHLGLTRRAGRTPLVTVVPQDRNPRAAPSSSGAGLTGQLIIRRYDQFMDTAGISAALPGLTTMLCAPRNRVCVHDLSSNGPHTHHGSRRHRKFRSVRRDLHRPPGAVLHAHIATNGPLPM